MDCIECKATNPDENRYCGQCGAELGRTLDETVRKKGFRDRLATEMEITYTVVSRLMKGVGWLITLGTIILAIIGYLLGKDSMNARENMRQVVEAGKTSISSEIQKGFKDISGVRQNINSLKVDIDKLNSDIVKYKKVTREMDMVIGKMNMLIGKMNNLEKELNSVKRQISGKGADGGVTPFKVETSKPVNPQIHNAKPGISPEGSGSGASQK